MKVFSTLTNFNLNPDFENISVYAVLLLFRLYALKKV